MTKTLQEHVKAAIAPYKYPRAVEYVTELPKTQTGKLQRFELRRMAAAGAPFPTRVIPLQHPLTRASETKGH